MIQQIDNSSAIIFSDIQHQRNEWRKKGWSIPELRGGKQAWFPLVTGLIKLLGEGQINDLNTYPQINGIKDSQSWRSYASFLKGLGLVTNQGGVLRLSVSGMAFHDDPTKRHSANLIQDKFNVFETLSRPEIGVLTTVTSSRSPENTVYILTEGKRAVNRLRALASAIDKGLFE